MSRSKLLDLLLIFGLPLAICCDPGSEFTAEVMQHLCRWLKVPLNHGLTNHSRAQGAVERPGYWLLEALPRLCTASPRGWDDFVPGSTTASRPTCLFLLEHPVTESSSAGNRAATSMS